MGIFGALTAAVSGMRAQSFALQNISGNIANSQTTAYKRLDTSFEDMIQSGAGPGKATAGTVVASSRSTNNVQGDIQNASTSTFMAVNGDGYFVVAKPTGFVDGRPVLGVESYTRRGDFEMDQNGYLVNGAGYYLLGIPTDPTTGNPLGSVPEVLQFNNNLSPATATGVIRYAANLPSIPVTGASDPQTPGSELLDTADFSDSDPTAAGDGVVMGTEVATFLDESVGGGALTVYDSLGVAENMQFRWAKTASADPSATPPVQDTWELFYQVDASATTNTEVAWQNAGTAFTFDGNGQLSPAVTSLTLTGVTLNGHAIGDIQMNFGSGGLTQFADNSGTVSVNQLQQNGSAAGTLESISVNDQNRIVGTFSNGLTVNLAQVTLAHFNAENKLASLDGGAFGATAESGAALYNATGSIVGSSLEGSNTDIADEFTKLIVTQQAYSANTRIITTGNEMVQDLLNMIR
jgi:flagellar hook protein FlgE